MMGVFRCLPGPGGTQTERRSAASGRTSRWPAHRSRNCQVSDIGITGLPGAKLASFGSQHDQRMACTLYLMTFGLDSIGDVSGSLFAVAAGALVIGSGVLPRWLGWASILAGIMFLLQGFGLGGVIATFGLILDLIGFLLFLTFVLVSSICLQRHALVSVSLANRFT